MELRALEIAVEHAVAELGARPQPNAAAADSGRVGDAGHLFDYCMDGNVSTAGWRAVLVLS